jgi:hypothetical protein
MPWSKEEKRYLLTVKCPLCGGYIFQPRYYTSNGKRALYVQRPAFAECPKCKGRWPRYASSPIPSPTQVVGVLDVIEVDRIEEPLGDETRTIDNSGSNITVTRILKATKDWMQNYSIEAEQARVTGQGLEIGAKEIGTFKANAEDTLRRKYSVSNEVRQTFSEEIGLTVPGRTKIRLTIQWKRIWQRGYVRIQHGPNRVVEVPFQMAVGVTFDQSQVDASEPTEL